MSSTRGVGPPHDLVETEAQTSDRQFNEQLQELRVAQTGVQIL